MDELGEAYAGVRHRVSALVEELDQARAATAVPGCPEWTVRDLVAHLVGVCRDVLVGNLEGVATEAWTGAQVEARRGCSLCELEAEWSELGPALEAALPGFPGRSARQLVADAATHEHDLRGALGSPGARDDRAVAIGLDFLAWAFGTSVTTKGLPALRMRAREREWVIGEGMPAATLAAPPFELFRALSGRRSLEQIRALGWEGDAEAYLPAFTFGPFRPAPVDLIE